MHSREHLGSLKVPEIKALIRKHNLHNAIKGYSSMRKAELVTAFLKFQPPAGTTGGSQASPPVKNQPSSGNTPIRAGSAKKPAKKKSKGSKKPKIMQADKAFGLGKPLYSKEEGGLTEGARKQFEKRYGKQTSKGDKDAIKRMAASMAAEKLNSMGRGKRAKRNSKSSGTRNTFSSAT